MSLLPHLSYELSSINSHHAGCNEIDARGPARIDR
jgi:hypothetical protein